MDDTNNVSDTPAVAAVDGAADNEKTLKRMWLNLVQLEQVIEIALKLDELVPADVKIDVWPQNLQTAVLSKALATIAKTGVNLTGSNPQKPSDSKEDTQKRQDKSSSPSGVGGSSDSRISEAEGLKSADGTNSSPDVPNHPASSPYATTRDKQLHPASHYAYPHGYPYPQLASGQQPYPYTYHTAHTPGATPYGPASVPSSSKAPSNKNEDDLPSYEEMLVQALIEFNDPAGTAPKQLFQWMAAHYPLQANFRPSASQALQKAYKRGRLEKNKDGRYRLNGAWEGGNTSKRTTRRPQSFTQAATNPSPSSHPPTTTYPPQYALAYTGMAHPMKMLSHSPPPTHVPALLKIPPETMSSASPDLSVDGESPHQAWEAAQSILQALNITPLLKTDATAGLSSKDDVSQIAQQNAEAQGVESAQRTPSASTYPPPITAQDISIGLSYAKGAKPPSTVSPLSAKSNEEPPPMAALLPTTSIFSLASSASTATDSVPSRTALQGALALLAAQLADIANESDAAAASATSRSADLAGICSGSTSFLQRFSANLP